MLTLIGPEAFRAFQLAHPRDSILLTCETPCLDGIPLPTNRYHLIYDNPTAGSPAPRTWAFVADSVVLLLEKYECSRDTVTLHLVDEWTIIASYSDPNSPIDHLLLRTFDLETVMIGDFNAKHPAWLDNKPSDDRQCLARGASLQGWSCRAHTAERGPRLATRHRTGDTPSNIDLI